MNNTTINLGILNTTQTQYTNTNLLIDHKTDSWGVIKDSDLFTMDLIAGNKYTFEITTSSQYRDLLGNLVYNDIDFSILDNNNVMQNKWTGLSVDTTTLSGTTFITFVANATEQHTLDIYGYAGYETDAFGNSSRIDTPYILKTQDMGAVDIYSNLISGAHTISLSDTYVDGDGKTLNKGSVTDANIYDSIDDTDWFKFTADETKDYIITVTTTDGVYKTLNLDGTLWGDRHSGHDDDNTKEYFYTPATSGEINLEVGGGIGEYTITVKEAVLDKEGYNAATAFELPLDTLSHTSLFSTMDWDYFKLTGLTIGSTYSVKVTTNQLNTNIMDNSFDLYKRSDTGDWEMNVQESDRYHTEGKEIYFIVDDTVEYFSINSWRGAVGDYDIIATELVDTIAGDNTTSGTLVLDDIKKHGFIENSSDSDWYKISLTEGETYVFSLDDYAIGNSLQLYDASGGIVSGSLYHSVMAGPYYATTDTLTYTASATADYYISINGSMGNYEIAYNVFETFDDTANDTIEGAVEIVIDKDNKYIHGQFDTITDNDWYKIYLEEGKSYVIHAESTTLNIGTQNDRYFSWLYDDAYEPLAGGDFYEKPISSINGTFYASKIDAFYTDNSNNSNDIANFIQRLKNYSFEETKRLAEINNDVNASLTTEETAIYNDYYTISAYANNGRWTDHWNSEKYIVNSPTTSAMNQYGEWLNKIGRELEEANVTTKAEIDFVVDQVLAYTPSPNTDYSSSTYVVPESDYYYINMKNRVETEGQINKIGDYTILLEEIGGDEQGESMSMAGDFAELTGMTEDFTSTYKNYDAVLDSRDDSDWFKVNFQKGGVYIIDTHDLYKEVKIYDADGERILIDFHANSPLFTKLFTDSGIRYKFTPTSTDDYYIDIAYRDGDINYSTPEYELSIKNLAGDDLIGQNKDSAMRLEDINNLEPTDKMEALTLDFNRDKDWIEIDTKIGANYTITLDSSMDFTNLTIFDAHGNRVKLNSELEQNAETTIGYKDNITINWQATSDVEINLATTWSKYYIQVDNYSEEGRYTLDVVENTDRDDYGSGIDNYGDFAQINSLDGNEADNTISGSLEQRNDRDWFKVELQKDTVYKIVFDSDSVDGEYLNMINSWGSSRSFVNDIVADKASDLLTGDSNYFYTAMYTGAHYINIENKYGAGDYELKFEQVAQDPNDAHKWNAQDISIGSTVEDFLLNQRDHDMKKVTLEAGKSYQIELSATDATNKALLGEMNVVISSKLIANIQDGVIKEWNPSDGTTMNRLSFTPATSGVFYIDVASSTKGIGSYSMNITELDIVNDIGSTTSTAGVFTDLDKDNDGSITSEINPSFDKDWIKYSFIGDESYIINLNSDTSDSGIIYLFDENGKLVKDNQLWDTTSEFASADRTIIFNPAENQEYYIVVADNKLNTYTLDVDTFVDADDFTADITTVGSVTTDGIITTSSITPESDKDWVKVSMVAGTVYKIDVTQKADAVALPLDLMIGGVYDASGNLIGNTTMNNGELIFKATQTGNHFIEIGSLNDTMGVYEITVSGISTDEKVLISNSVHSDTVGTMIYDNTKEYFEQFNSSIDYYGDEDWIKVTLKAGTAYDIDLKGINLRDTFIGGIYNTNGNIVNSPHTSNDNASSYTLDSHVTFTAGSDTNLSDGSDIVYFIKAQGEDGETGSYNLQVSLDDGTDDIAVELHENSKLKKYIYGEINEANDTDLFEYNFEAGVTYEVNMYGASTDTGSLDNTFIKSIKYEDGSYIAEGSNARGGMGNDSYLMFTAEDTGKYYIETASLLDDTGSFRLKVKEETSSLNGTMSKSDGSHTIMIYLAGDNNLEVHMVEDLIEMQLGSLPDDWNVTFLIDRSEEFYTGYGDWSDTREGIISFVDVNDVNVDKYEMASSMESLGELNTGDGETLTNFINWSVRNANADSYSLIISNHGGGITGSAWDDTNGHDNLEIDELTKAIEASLAFDIDEWTQSEKDADLKAFEMIGFDTCLQGVIDQQYSLESVTDIILASEEVSWSDFWDYEAWFNAISEFDEANGGSVGDVTGEEMASLYVDLMQAYDESGALNGRDMTYSVVDTTALSNVKDKVATLNEALQDINAKDAQAIKNGITGVVTFGNDELIDIGAYAKFIDSLDIGGVDGAGIDADAKALLSAVEAAVLNNYTNMSGSSGDEAMGISMYYHGGYESASYMDNFELADLMNMHEFYEVV